MKPFRVYLFWSGFKPASGDCHRRNFKDKDTAERFAKKLRTRAEKVHGRSYDTLVQEVKD